MYAACLAQVTCKNKRSVTVCRVNSVLVCILVCVDHVCICLLPLIFPLQTLMCPCMLLLQTLVTLELSSRPDLPSFTTSVTHTAAPGPQTTSSHTLSLPSPPSMSESQSDSTSASHHHEQAVARGDGWEVRVALKRVVPNQPAAVRGQGVQRRAIHQAAGPSVLLEAIQEYGKGGLM